MKFRFRNIKLIKGAILLMALFCVLEAECQNQRKADSLINILQNEDLKEERRLEILSKVSIFSTDPKDKIEYANQVLLEAIKTENHSLIITSYIVIGGAHSKIGQLEKSLVALFEAAEYAKSLEMHEELGAIYGQIASTYSLNNDLRNSLLFKKKSLKLFEQVNDYEYIGYGSLNIGYEYYKLKEYDSALYYTQKAQSIFEELEFEVGIAYAIGNTALVRWKQGDYLLAEDLLHKAIEKLRPVKDYYAMADYLHNLARVLFEQEKISQSIEAAQEALEMSLNNNLKEQARDASLMLSELYEDIGDHKESYTYHKQFVALKDSIQSIEATQKMADLRTEFEVGQKQAEVDLLTAEKRTQRIITIAVGAFAFILIVLAAIIYKYYRSKAKINRILGEQKAELERLNSTKDKFFSIISHDLRSPVAGFNGISQMIKMMVQTKQTDQLLEMTEHIDSSVDQLSKLLDNLLNWAMQQQGHVPNVPEKLSLKEMAEDLVKTLSTMAQGKSIELGADVPEALELWCDKNTTMTILRNLVSNALKFTPEGGEVGIKATEENGTAKIEVYDTGVGMPQDKLRKLFQLQDKKSTYGTSGEKGLGLGLQLVHEFMEMNNGKIEVSSEEGKGTTFTLWLPLFEAVGSEVAKQ
ncbi:Signal transduction histidine kinase [Ekhidna lutea]|uniref:histidine kinase n=1 Tax=Ekhidna lutea TaxID=447679 RepID=A0A239L7Z6_EKHLU|nr:tetratricopeptide repeat-containing sensor histidine kinase [Ekhidna lutea]SNT25654.1 Signal transduction histidine kinase [Ekhidna lutea]